MAVIKCKMCGGDLDFVEGASTAECEFCGSIQTIPKADDEKKLTLFARANRLRAACEFDKAASVYESIVADFPEEAEAYWGLVLCKYGIEYVDDPATGKKIPTCHRSSFDSMMEDSDYEQVLENADATARKVYREEAKVIEENRKNIISVSSSEAPYDIFICYKETAENGDRTLDSVLAQDVYDALTEKGYRVFFSRITLEDKLGMEYEPYIFAALNSAKVMLVFGTDYDYFNAVWVKNEWSRFLKLMASDKTKHLIPCFKGIDAYDMPKEFTRLQAQDLGKVGAIQDLLRGIEKLLPKQQTTTVVQEKVVVGGSADNKVAALLDRGNMALEDGDWAKADSFFEDVLNNDSKNAQAYLGKTLAQEKCRTIDAFVRKRREASQHAKAVTLRFKPEQSHIEEMVQQYVIAGYVEAKAIRDLYTWDQTYLSEVASRRQQYTDEQNYWAGHKWLSRAEKFAVGAVAENLQREKKALFAVLAERVKKAEEAEAAAKAQAQRAYEEQLAYSDERAQALHQKGAQQKEAYYQRLLETARTSADIALLQQTAKKLQALGDYKESQKLAQHCKERSNEVYYESLLEIAKTSSNIEKLKETAAHFDELGDYRDSKNLAQHCRDRAQEEQEKIDAEIERQRLLKEKQAKERARKAKRTTIAVAAVLVLVIAAALFVTQYLIPNSNYNAAEALLAEGKYAEARIAFMEMGEYKNSALMPAVVDEIGQLKNGNYEAAMIMLEKYGMQISAQYDLNGKGDTLTLNYGEEGGFGGLLQPKSEGYRFVKWELQNCQYQPGGNVDVSFRAVWTDGYLIEYVLDGGTATNPGEYHKDGEAVTLNNPTKKGYTFVGWTGTDLSEPTMKVTIPAGSYGDRTYTANWKANEYTFTLNADGGKVDVATLSASYDSDYTLPIPTREYYTFVGWYNNTVKYENGMWKYAGDVTLTAKWSPVQYSITYGNTYGAENTNVKIYAVTSPKITLKSISREGYKFLGWYTDSAYQNKIETIESGSHGDLTLYAKWEIIQYTITYTLNGGTISGTKVTKFTVEDLPLKLPTAKKTDYVFLGWKLNDYYGGDVTSVTNCGDIKLYAAFMDVYLQMEFVDNWSGKYYAVKKYSGTATTVDIPATYKGYPVTKISSSAFSGCSKVKTINLPDSITVIESSAFYRCNALTKIVIPDGVTSIGSSAFASCTGLTSVTLPDTVTFLGEGAFQCCTALTSVKLSENLKTMGNYAFRECTSLKSINIPGSLKVIEYCTFGECNNLATVILNEGLEEIEFGAFGCPKLKKLIIPNSVKEIDSDAFDYNYSGVCSSVSFYCRAESMPGGWDAGWNAGRPVTWGYTGN